MEMETTDSFREFVIGHWPSDEVQWFKKLGELGWVGADWPLAFGGTGWTRQEQVNLITVLSEHRCPLTPDSVNVIAPMLLAFGSMEQKHYFLPRIQASPEAYTFQTQDKIGPGCLLDQESANLYLINDGGSATLFGSSGEATAMLAASYSPLWLLYEKMLGLAHLKKMSDYWEEATSTELTEISIETSSLTGHFLQNSAKADSQIGLRVNRDRCDLYGSLFQPLGYYALLAPDYTLVSNEPIPFTAERAYLQTMRQQVARDTMIQQDQLYKEHLQHEDT